jgi:hypothetical protein
MDETIFVIIHGPETPPDESAYLGFYEAIGRFVIVWGRFEQHLENLQRMSLNIAARSTPRQQRMTIPLAAKLDRLCKLFRTCPELLNYLPRMNDLARLTRNLGEFRHKLIHSNFANFEDGPPLKIHLHVVSHDRDDNVKVESFSTGARPYRIDDRTNNTPAP